MGLRIDTFRFNIMIVLSFAIVLYILLYAELLRRIIAFFEKLKASKRRALKHK